MCASPVSTRRVYRYFETPISVSILDTYRADQMLGGISNEHTLSVKARIFFLSNIQSQKFFFLKLTGPLIIEFGIYLCVSVYYEGYLF